jgi:hypothetical protein
MIQKMSKKAKTSNESSLLAAIQRKAPTSPTAPAIIDQVKTEAVVETSPRRKAARRAESLPAAKSRVGKPVQFWLHEEDRQLVRELAAWLAGQGIRTTDTMVIRSALRMAKTGGELLDAARQASQLDGRLKQHKTA